VVRFVELVVVVVVILVDFSGTRGESEMRRRIRELFKAEKSKN